MAKQAHSGKYLLLFSVIAAMTYLSFNTQEDAIELASKADGKSARTTELGESVPSKKKFEREVDIKLADPQLAKKWGLKMTDSDKAWNKLKAKGSKDIVIAVIDTGVDVHHIDLRNNLWVNKGETGLDAQGRDKATNGIDDDGNGFVDDVHGWNFVANNSDLKDNHGHGTHIAGIIGAEGGNGKGISGVAPNVSLMVLKYYDPKAPGTNNLMNTVRAIRYATAMGAKIINYSGGGLEQSPAEKMAISEAQRKGILFVAAAGNERSNSDIKAYYPADYPLDNIISVTAIDKSRNVLPTSNYGVQSVDIAAPGNEIYSTLPDGKYGLMTGTSQATAYVTGVAALIMAKYKDHDAKQIIKHLTETGDFDNNLAGKTRYKKRLNTYRALSILDQGMTVSGAIVKNAPAVRPETFASDPQAVRSQASLAGTAGGDDLGNMVDFSKALQELMLRTHGDSRATHQIP